MILFFLLSSYCNIIVILKKKNYLRFESDPKLKKIFLIRRIRREKNDHSNLFEEEKEERLCDS